MPNDLNLAIDMQSMDRLTRTDQLLKFGDIFYFTVDVDLPSPAAAGATRLLQSNSVEFDFVIEEVSSNLCKSTIEISDNSRGGKSITNGAAPISAVANCVAGSVVVTQFNSQWNYLLLSKGTLKITVVGDGTETGGKLTFKCRQPLIIG